MSTQQLLPLAQWLLGWQRATTPEVVAINGAQGSGKTTLAFQLQELLGQQYDWRALVLSIDDIYLHRAQREKLAQSVHPLLRTRGVPGTHEVELGLRLLEQLGELGTTADPARQHPKKPVRMPKFIKAIDDRAPESDWTTVEGPVDLILFEGWCVGTPPQDPAELREPVNDLEAQEDADGTWRHYVNQQLETVYPRLFARIDKTIFLKAPDFDSIYRWRLEQEAKNAEALRSSPAPAAAVENRADSRIMGPEELRRFIQHYERLTRHALEVMPDRADVVIELGVGHEVLETWFRRAQNQHAAQ